ncbi:simple sugar transport system substrate-binding protein [Rubricella aquisinus]|uniref:Simple sugar transport system substrate-binding protein n=1 Tax=Rubricella aquisinus TaxID=2028108 RepID=A0A840WLR0_9RHOB|nr:BMP family ABC transporter substrate-binding protein [Rubricella aquisinus]MBB5515073.1 simple sugar transport system substrate-binding protein [Rubricella aquisinus]
MTILKTLATAALALGLATGMASAESHGEPTKVGFIYVGPVGDYGWSYQHDQGRIAVEEHFGDKVETTFIESVPEGDSERAIRQLAQSGHDIIFTTSFGYMTPTNRVAAQFPDVKFEHATGYQRNTPNVSTYSGRFYEGRTVQGIIAGHMTETNTIGYIASFPIPEVIRGINASYLAAKSVNPDVEFKIIWVSTWFDPGKEADAANALIEQGADVILQHTDSTAPLTIAEERGIYGFGQASDMLEFGPNSRLSSIIDDWAPYYISRVQAVMDGTWESQDTWHGIDEGMTSIGSFNPVIPAAVRKQAMDAAIQIAAGNLHPFTGPINKQDGTPWLAEGETADDGTLLGMNFYVEGIEGSIPN